ncbi:MAG TPA: ArsR family transcriptional regulator [Gammaproteobacteria bacterium]|uniref:GbsR/MarR family transcriptional regulator n=1 Tax=Immundisolibacter sp. TaxID=1934948 RepID=UPI000E83218D|nr:ArsR family transcriptional regulator [Gammaproteobacteria bacterium]HCZ48474.1 ArsR family transcriptional regulator [Gammaproteobacteria bacterium]MCH77912.1 ArsR family transcriptional regulator [Gammaproteobacteria bacterium]
MTDMTPLVRDFVMHFGEMGSRWGINRTVGQIYALLFVSPRPLNADDIAEQLAISRSNVSMSLKELQGWRLLRSQRLAGDRRDYFSTPEDVWQIFKTLAEERQRREVEPTLSMLREALLAQPQSQDERHAQLRMREMYTLMETLTEWFGQVQRLSPQTLLRLMALGTKVKGVLHLLPGGRESDDREASA